MYKSVSQILAKVSGPAIIGTPTYGYFNTEEFCEEFGYLFYHPIPDKEVNCVLCLPFKAGFSLRSRENEIPRFSHTIAYL